MIIINWMEKQYENPASMAIHTENIISPNINMNQNTKNQLLRELLDGITLDDLKILVDLKKEIHSISKPSRRPIPRKSVNQMAQEYEDNIILPPPRFRDGYKPVPRKPISTPQKSVKDMVKKYENNIILPPPRFRDGYKPVPLPRTKKQTQLPKPVPLPRTKIEETDKALKGYTSSYKISIKHSTDPLSQLQNTRKAVEYHIIKALSAMKGLKFIETLKVTFSKAQDDGLIYKSAFFNSQPQTIINNISISEALQLTKQQILNFVAQWISEGSGWTIQSVDSHYLNTVKYEPLKGSSYIQLPTELRNSAKGLINLKNDDNEASDGVISDI